MTKNHLIHGRILLVKKSVDRFTVMYHCIRIR